MNQLVHITVKIPASAYSREMSNTIRQDNVKPCYHGGRKKTPHFINQPFSLFLSGCGVQASGIFSGPHEILSTRADAKLTK